MKLVSRKTRKAINKSLRKAIRKNAPMLVAALASGVASALATLGRTESPDTPGKSNLSDMVDRARETLVADGPRAPRGRDPRRAGSRDTADDQEGARPGSRRGEAHPQTT